MYSVFTSLCVHNREYGEYQYSDDFYHGVTNYRYFLADRTIGRAFATRCRLSVCLSVCDVLY